VAAHAGLSALGEAGGRAAPPMTPIARRVFAVPQKTHRVDSGARIVVHPVMARGLRRCETRWPRAWCRCGLYRLAWRPA
jgi:hypothetical protein